MERTVKVANHCRINLYLIVCIYREVIHLWIVYFGSSDEARNHSCKISIKNKFGIKFVYSGPVHTLDKHEKAIINSGFLLMIGPNAAKSLMNKKKDVQIKVSIQNLKNETISKESQIFYQKDTSEDVYIDMDRSDGDTDSE